MQGEFKVLKFTFSLLYRAGDTQIRKGLLCNEVDRIDNNLE